MRGLFSGSCSKTVSRACCGAGLGQSDLVIDWDKSRVAKFGVPATRFSDENGQFPQRNLSPGLVAGNLHGDKPAYVETITVNISFSFVLSTAVHIYELFNIFINAKCCFITKFVNFR